jgi:hypothetical protein
VFLSLCIISKLRHVIAPMLSIVAGVPGGIRRVFGMVVLALADAAARPASRRVAPPT